MRIRWRRPPDRCAGKDGTVKSGRPEGDSGADHETAAATGRGAGIRPGSSLRDQAVRLTRVRHEVHGDDPLMRGFVKYPEKMFVDEATFTRKLYGE